MATCQRCGQPTNLGGLYCDNCLPAVIPAKVLSLYGVEVQNGRAVPAGGDDLGNLGGLAECDQCGALVPLGARLCDECAAWDSDSDRPAPY